MSIHEGVPSLIHNNVDTLLGAAVALAAHFRGNGGLEYKFRPPTKRNKNGSLTIYKNGKAIYRGRDDGGIGTLLELFKDIIKKERIQGHGNRHEHCHVCRFTFKVISENLQHLRMGLSIGEFLGPILEKISEGPPKEPKKPTEENPDPLEVN